MDVVAAKPADGPAIGTILSGWIDETPWMPRIHTPEQDINHGRWLVDVCDVSVVRSGGEVQGFLARQGPEIQALYVTAASRGQRIGAALLDHAKEAADTLSLWTFQANGAALRFYQRHGFTEDGRSDGAENDEKLPDIHMIWRKDLP